MVNWTYCTEKDFDSAVGMAGVAVSQMYINESIAWGLKCPDKWARLRESYNKCDPGYRTIPELPRGYGTRWIKIMFDVWKWYRGELAKIRPVNTDEDRWESFVISYMAISRLALTKQHQEISLCYTACKNDHIDHLRKLGRSHSKDISEGEFVTDSLDFQLDFEEAMSKLPPKQLMVARLRLLEGLDWDSIATTLDMSDRHARRLYADAEGSLRDSLASYAELN